jgi:hypothetical protein
LSFARNAQVQAATFRCTLQGLPGIDFSVERSTDLVNWQSWRHLKLPRTPLDLELKGSGAGAHQFFRARIR